MQFVLVLFLGVLAACGDKSSQPDAAPLAEFGEACELDSQCTTGTCETDRLGLELPGGLCTEACVWGTPCEQGVCVGNNSPEGYCYPTCEVGCREGWVCAWFFTEFCVPESFIGLAMPDCGGLGVTRLEATRSKIVVDSVREIRLNVSVQFFEKVTKTVVRGLVETSRVLVVHEYQYKHLV